MYGMVYQFHGQKLRFFFKAENDLPDNSVNSDTS